MSSNQSNCIGTGNGKKPRNIAGKVTKNMIIPAGITDRAHEGKGALDIIMYC